MAVFIISLCILLVVVLGHAPTSYNTQLQFILCSNNNLSDGNRLSVPITNDNVEVSDYKTTFEKQLLMLYQDDGFHGHHISTESGSLLLFQKEIVAILDVTKPENVVSTILGFSDNTGINEEAVLGFCPPTHASWSALVRVWNDVGEIYIGSRMHASHQWNVDITFV